MHGHLSHVPIGTLFDSRRSLYASGVHRDIRRAICGSAVPGRGVESIVLSGGYEDDVDLGEVIYYTGQGGRDKAGRQVEDQQMVGLNGSLARNVATEDPVRVVRATTLGFRYDGLYLVEDAWMGPGASGRIICRYRLRLLIPVPDDADVGDIEPATVGKRPKPADRRMSTHYRLVRDGAVPGLVKSLYDFTCQICGARLETVGGAYAEGAHLVPLGGGHQGVDHISNVLCLCPNHHVLLDHGAIALTDDWEVIDRSGAVIGRLQIHDDHGLDRAHAARHRLIYGFGPEIRANGTVGPPGGSDGLESAGADGEDTVVSLVTPAERTDQLP